MQNAETDKSGRIAQMEAIVAEHETSLLRYATRILNNPAAAQDVVQNVFIKLFTNWQDGTRPSKKLRSWLYSVTHNEAVDFIRRESRLNVLHKKHAEEEAIGTQRATSDCPDGVNCTEDRKEQVLGLLRKLDPASQQVVLLRMEEGLSYREIAEITGRSEGNVGNILHHAVKKLAENISRGERREFKNN